MHDFAVKTKERTQLHMMSTNTHWSSLSTKRCTSPVCETKIFVSHVHNFDVIGGLQLSSTDNLDIGTVAGIHICSAMMSSRKHSDMCHELCSDHGIKPSTASKHTASIVTVTLRHDTELNGYLLPTLYGNSNRMYSHTAL